MEGHLGVLFSREGKGGEHRQKEYGDTYTRMVNNTTKQLIENFREFVKHLFWDEVTV